MIGRGWKVSGTNDVPTVGAPDPLVGAAGGGVVGAIPVGGIGPVLGAVGMMGRGATLGCVPTIGVPSGAGASGGRRFASVGSVTVTESGA
jgi:hypothetical protein